jgi:hypothetical protein
MITKRFISISIFPKALIGLVIIMSKSFTRPTIMALYTKMIVCFNSQSAVAIIRFKYALSQSNTCRNARSLHFINGNTLVRINIF